MTQHDVQQPAGIGLQHDEVAGDLRFELEQHGHSNQE
jgi:hypothetical protein